MAAQAGAGLVEQPRIGRPHDQMALLPHAQAVIDVVEADREFLFVESAEFLIERAPRHHAGGGDGGEILLDLEPAPIAERVAGRAVIGMVGGAAPADAENDAAMLNPA